MAGGDKANILLVDDQPGKLLSYEAMLSGLGETLIPARSAREALGHLLSTDVAVVPIDVCMPELDGFDLASMMREPPRFQQTPIIFVSGVHLTELVGLHRGQVRAHSDGPGHGTEVVVRLLIENDDGQMVIRQPAAGDAAAAPAIRPRRILIVDDNLTRPTRWRSPCTTPDTR